VTGGFREILDDPTPRDPQRVSRVVMCSGKIYYDLLAAREERTADHIAIVRLEQLYPFLSSSVNDILLRYPLTAEVIWAQEEPRNMGPWRFLREQIQPLLDSPAANYATSEDRRARARRRDPPSVTNRSKPKFWTKLSRLAPSQERAGPIGSQTKSQ